MGSTGTRGSRAEPVRRLRRPWLLRALAVGLSLAGLAGGTVGPMAAQALTAPAPGLPPFNDVTIRRYFSPEIHMLGERKTKRTQLGSVLSAFATGQTDAGRAKVAIRLPTTLTAINLLGNNLFRAQIKNGKRIAVPAGFHYLGQVYVQSPQGVTPAYGVIPAVKVSALAFGIIPVTVTLSLSQPRTGRTTAARSGAHAPDGQRVAGGPLQNNNLYDTHVTGDLQLELADLRVDGRLVDVGPSCGTVTPAQVALIGKYQSGGAPGFYDPTFGGDLYGTLSVPSFAGCRGASGEDLSPLLTNALSGNATALHLFQGPAGQPGVGCVPTLAIPCVQAKPLPVPTGGGQVPSQPQDWTPDPPPAPLPILTPAPTAAP